MKRQGGEELGRRVLLGVRRIDTIDVGGFEDHLRFDFERAQHGCRVGREVGIPGAAGEDHHAAFVEVAHRAPPDVRLRQLFHANRRHHPRIDALLLQDVLQRQCIDYGREHPHVVGGHTIHPLLARRRAAQNVAAADHEAELHARRGNGLQLIR